MQGSTTSNPALVGLTQSDIIALNERTYHSSYEAYYFCAPRCFTHYGEESLPYHPGEKTCLDRCMWKVKIGAEMATKLKEDFQTELQQNHLPYKWMKQMVPHDE